MRSFVALLCLAALACASAQSYGGYGNGFKYRANIGPHFDGDLSYEHGTTFVRTNGDTLHYQTTMFGGEYITGIDIRLVPRYGYINDGPLVLALRNTTAPQNPGASSPMNFSGRKTTADLLANPMLSAARAKLAELGVTDNTLQNIGDVDRLLARGLAYCNVHSVTRPSPQQVGSGIFYTIPQTGRRLRSFV